MGETPKRSSFPWVFLALILAIGAALLLLFDGGAPPPVDVPEDKPQESMPQAPRTAKKGKNLPAASSPAPTPIAADEPGKEEAQKVSAPANSTKASLRGRVTLEGNYPPPRFRISVHYAQSQNLGQPRMVRQAESDDRGFYEIAELVPGKCKILLHSISFPEPTLAFEEREILSGERMQGDFLIRLGRARGVLVADQAAVVSKATIRVFEGEEGEDRKKSRGARSDLRADEMGRFQTEWMPLEQWTLLVEGSEGYGAEHTFRLELGEADLGEIRLEPGKHEASKRPQRH